MSPCLAGLVTLNDMKAKQEALVKEREKQLAKKEQSKELQLKLEKLREKERKKEAKRKISSLSFTLEEEEEAGEEEEEMAMYEEELEREGEGKLGAPGRGPARSPLSRVSGSRADIHHPASIAHCARGPQPHTSGQERKSQVCSVCKAELGWGLAFSGRVSRSPAYIPWAQAWGLWCESLPG